MNIHSTNRSHLIRSFTHTPLNILRQWAGITLLMLIGMTQAHADCWSPRTPQTATCSSHVTAGRATSTSKTETSWWTTTTTYTYTATGGGVITCTYSWSTVALYPGAGDNWYTSAQSCPDPDPVTVDTSVVNGGDESNLSPVWQEIPYDGNLTVTAYAGPGYELLSFADSTCPGTASGTQFEVTGATENCNVTAHFQLIPNRPC
jgi:hypothetical protein